MPDSFQCPKCGASYTRERRQTGKAVVCTCGHKFLVPPRDFASPPPAAPSRPSSPVRSVDRAGPGRRARRPATASDSSGEVLPLAEPVQPVAPQAAPWAEPVEPHEAAPLMEAEVVYPAAPYAEPIAPAYDAFGAGGAYGPPLAAPPPRSPPKKRAKKRRSEGDGAGSIAFSNWVAYSVLFALLPAAALFTILGFIQYQRSRPAATARSSTRTPSATKSSNAPNEPAPSGYPLTIWGAAKRSSSNEFSLEYRLDHGPLDAARQYFWIVKGAQQKVEFPIPASLWKSRDKLSGKPDMLAPGEFAGPYTTFIEEEVGGARSRVSNDSPVVVDGS